MKQISIFFCVVWLTGGDSLLADLNDGLVAYYPFNGNANDESGNGNHGTSYDATLTADRFGVPTSAYSFNGSSSGIEVTNIFPMQNEQTIAIWVKPAALNGIQPIIEKAIPGFGGEIDFQMFLQGDGTVSWWVNTEDGSTGTFAFAAGHSSLPVEQWSFITCVTSQTSNTVCLFVDGILDATGPMGGRTVRNRNYPFRIGKQIGNAATRWFNGTIDDVKIYNRVLTESEILTLSGNAGPPVFYSSPQSQTVRAPGNVTFATAARGAPVINYQWQFNGADIPDATNATLTLSNVQPGNAGRYTVWAVNAFGSAVSRAATLAVLGDPANGAPASPVAIPDAPPKDAGQDSLIVITHGWQPSEAIVVGTVFDVGWMDGMSNAVRRRLTGQANWQIRTIDWKELAYWPGPELPLLRATSIGNLLGRQIGKQTWNHVHLIGHSAGAGLIQEAAYQIKSLSHTTTVHTTFLDPYVGYFRENYELYGQYADWSDTYYARDISGPLTSDVPHSHSVDVTNLDPDHSLTHFLHSWPYQFYTRTVTDGFAGTIGGDPSLGYGFRLSMEGGGWANRGNYPIGNTPVVLDGYLPITLPANLPFNIRLPINLTMLSVSGNSLLVSTPGTVQINGDLFQLITGSTLTPQSAPRTGGGRTARAVRPMSGPQLDPAWVSLGVTVTNPVNYVKFEAGFTSASGAQGLFSVYWGTNQIGALDERTASAGLQTYQFLLPDTYTEGQYTLGFRLDAYTNTPSSLALTNIFTGFVGITNPPTLTVAPSATNGSAQITLTGATGFYSILQSSTNLTNWTPVAALVNSNGTVQFSDTGATNQVRRFYRAVVP